MSPSYYIPILLLFLILYVMRRNQRMAARNVMKKRKTKENEEMIELAKRFIGKECLVYAFDNNHQYAGVIREVEGGALLLEKEGQLEAVNLDYVIRIREYPRNKNGKKKSVILD